VGKPFRKRIRRSRIRRPVLPRIIIVCDDKQAAPDYFRMVRAAFKQRATMHIAPAPKGAEGVVDLAKREKKKLNDNKRTTARRAAMQFGW
jgi:hypothetical protein